MNRPYKCARWQLLLLGLGAACTVAAVSIYNVADFDLWGYMAFGKEFWNTPGFPYTDPFSYLPTRDVWIYHEWLTGVILYPVYNTFGGPGLQILKYLTIGGMTYCIYKGALLRNASPCLALVFLLLWSPFIAFGFSPIRAQAFTYLFFAMTLLLLEWCRLRDRYRPLFLFIPMMLVWANLHGGFLSGLAMPFVYWGSAIIGRRKAWPYGAIALAAGMVTLINPYGLAYWQELIDAVSMARPTIVEWQSTLSMLQGGEYQGHAQLFLALALLTAALLAANRTLRDPALPVLLLTGYMATSHVRHFVFFALAFGLYVPSLLDAFVTTASKDAAMVRRWRWLAVIWLLIPPIAFMDCAWNLTSRLRQTPPFALTAVAKTDPQDQRLLYPVGAVAFIKDKKLYGNILPNFAWGEYLLWELAPECRIGIDGRYETVFPPAITAAYFDFLYVRPNGVLFLDKWPHDMLLFATSDDVYYMAKDYPDWVEVYADLQSRLFARRSFLKEQHPDLLQ